MEDGRLVSIALVVADLDASTAFYRDVLGLQIREDPDPPGGRSWISGESHVEVQWREDSILRLALVQADAERPPSSGIDLSFVANDLETMHRRALESGVTVVHGPQPWNTIGGQIARYLDPDGNTVGFVRTAQ